MTTLPAITPTSTIREAIATIDRYGKGIVLVVDDADRLIGTVTRGDIGRAILDCDDIDAPVSTLLASKPPTAPAHPIVAPQDANREVLLMLMAEWKVQQIPCLDAAGHVVSLATIDDLLPDRPLGVEAVVMAGGFGTRLRPLTDDCPKPMLPIGDRPLLQRTVERLRDAGIQRVSLTTHYLPERIMEHFGDGSAYGVDIRYIAEDHPLGTAGALANVQSEGTLLVLNGDLVQTIDYRAMLAYHREHGADLTVAACQMETQVPYGVLECEGPYVANVLEKPFALFLINAGVYLVEPSARALIPTGARFDMTQLIERVMRSKGRVAAFALIEQWRDVGTPESYAAAQKEAASAVDR